MKKEPEDWNITSLQSPYEITDMVRDHKPMAVNITRETTARYDYMPLVEILVMKYSSQKKKKTHKQKH